MTVKVRIAPSPTGYMHIGTARTALFNYLYAKNQGGQFYLRIEDTDRERSTPEAVDALLNGLKWMGLDWDGETIFQAQRGARHAEVALEMLKNGKAYYCYASQAELEGMREEQKAKGQPMRYDGRWRDRDPKDAPADIKPVIRLKAPQTGETVVKDHVLGEIRVNNVELDDMVLLRSDGTPTYMLAVVVDDHDMDITHVLRGQDHMTNTFRQVQIYQGMGWTVPEFGHIPLINGEDGKKLSKRHGAVGLHEYDDMGYLPEAIRNYLLRLGWSHGDDEIISDVQAREWFNLENIQKSPARFDTKKLNNLNGHYIRLADDARLLELIIKRMGVDVDEAAKARILRGMTSLKQRVQTLNELAEAAKVYVRKDNKPTDAKAAAIVESAESKDYLRGWMNSEPYRGLNSWDASAIETSVRNYAEQIGVKMGNIAQPLRVAVTGTTVSPPIFEVMEILGKDVVVARVETSVS